MILLTNTDDGSQWSVSGKLERPFRNGLYASASYIYGRAESVNDGTSSQALSNWRFVYVPGDINNPPVAYSNFDVRHRINAAVSWDVKLFSHAGAVLSLFYNGQSGPAVLGAVQHRRQRRRHHRQRPASTCPANVNEVVVRNGTPAQLEAFIANDPGLAANRGRIVPRNASRSPWTDTLDFRAAVNVPWGRRKVELTLDMLNLINLIDSDKGRFTFTSNQNIAPIQYGGIDAATGKPIYNIATIASPDLQQVHDRRPALALAGTGWPEVAVLDSLRPRSARRHGRMGYRSDPGSARVVHPSTSRARASWSPISTQALTTSTPPHRASTAATWAAATTTTTTTGSTCPGSAQPAERALRQRLARHAHHGHNGG